MVDVDTTMVRTQSPLRSHGHAPIEVRLTVSLKTLSKMLDAHRSSVRRWLQEAGIKPMVLGRGRNGAIRYLWTDVERRLGSLERID